MSRRRSLPSWQVLIAAACGLALVLLGTDLDWGFGPSLFLGLLGGAVVFAGVRGRGRVPARPSAGHRSRPQELPPLRPGHQVLTVRDLGAGGTTELVPRGTRGVVTRVGWGQVEASFPIYGALGVRQVVVKSQRADFQRL